MKRGRGRIFAFCHVAASLVLVSLGPAATRAELPEGVLNDGTTFRGLWDGLQPDGRYQFKLASGTLKQLKPASLQRWGHFVDPVEGPQVYLRDGTVLVAEVRQIDRTKMQVHSPQFGNVTLPLDAVAGILFHPPLDSARRDQLSARVEASDSSEPRLLLDNGDELSGLLDLQDDALTLEVEGSPIPLDLARITALVMPSSAKPTARPSDQVAVGFGDGTRVMAKQLGGSEGKLRLALAGGLKLATENSEVVGLQRLGESSAYLSDMKAAAYKFIPYLQLAWPYQTDRNVSGGRLRHDGKLILKGLGMHSASSLAYELQGRYRFFRARGAIDDAVGSKGSVVFRVFVDNGDGKWQPKYTSPVVRGGDAPVPISVDLKGAKRLSLLVEYADRGDELDDADWLDARLER